MAEKLLTVGEAADQVGMQRHRLAKLYDRGLLPEPVMIGRARAVRVDDLPQIREVASREGYLTAKMAEAC